VSWQENQATAVSQFGAVTSQIEFQSAALTAWANTWTLELHHWEARCDAPSSPLP